jgi:hypothetical protein
MTLPNGFLFNQGNLQDYMDCQRRFQLRHMLHQAWPAIEVEPFLEFERISELGSRFHKIVRQQLSGVPESSIDLSVSEDEVLQDWWENYKHSINDGILKQIQQVGNKLYVEQILTIPLGKFRLIAKYDLLVIQPDGKILIIDWKTSKNRPKQKWLENRLQTHVYPFVFSLAAASINDNNPIDPGKIEMLYWFSNQPEKPERFYYNNAALNADAGYLSNLTTEISQKTEADFQLTFDEKHCLFCTYRSLCDRGVKPGDLHQLEEWQESGQPVEEVSLEYDQIIEIEF